MLGPSPEGWRLICLSLEEAATCCREQPPPQGPAFSGRGSIHGQGTFFASPRFFQLTSLYFKSLEILCFIIMFLQEHWSGLPFPPPMHESEK